MKTALRPWLVFFQFMHRDLVVRKKRLWDNIINFAILYPLIYGLEIAYLQVNIYFKSINIERNTYFFAGNIILVMMIFAYNQNIELLFDFENKRFIDYQITVLNPFLVLLERIFFTGMYTFFIILPVYPITAWVFADYLDMSHACWPKVFIILLLGSLCVSAYNILAACLLENSMGTRSLWPRVNRPLIFFGGFAIPWYVIYKYSPLFAYCVCLNPCIYITEGVKSALTAQPQFIPFYICVPMLIISISILTMWGWYAFKRRTDCL